MNKKGFTLVELLAVIAILGILAIMITPGIIAIRNRVLESTLESKENFILNAALQYTSDHLYNVPNGEIDSSELIDRTMIDNPSTHHEYSCCYYITINNLIDWGYLANQATYTISEDGTQITQVINPVTGEVMNNRRICVRYDNNDALNRELIAFFVD